MSFPINVKVLHHFSWMNWNIFFNKCCVLNDWLQTSIPIQKKCCCCDRRLSPSGWPWLNIQIIQIMSNEVFAITFSHIYTSAILCKNVWYIWYRWPSLSHTHLYTTFVRCISNYSYLSKCFLINNPGFYFFITLEIYFSVM